MFNIYTFFTVVASSLINPRFEAAKKLLQNIQSNLNVNVTHVLILADSEKAKSIVPVKVADNRKIVCVPFDEINLKSRKEKFGDQFRMFWNIQDLNKLVQQL
jgi:hypothetical protein